MHAPRAILFDHIPKCAGTSLAEHLFARCAGRPVLRLDGSAQDEATRRFAALPEPTRHGYALIAGHGAFRLAPFAAPDALRITVLRDGSRADRGDHGLGSGARDRVVRGRGKSREIE